MESKLFQKYEMPNGERRTTVSGPLKAYGSQVSGPINRCRMNNNLAFWQAEAIYGIGWEAYLQGLFILLMM